MKRVLTLRRRQGVTQFALPFNLVSRVLHLSPPLPLAPSLCSRRMKIIWAQGNGAREKKGGRLARPPFLAPILFSCACYAGNLAPWGTGREEIPWGRGCHFTCNYSPTWRFTTFTDTEVNNTVLVYTTQAGKLEANTVLLCYPPRS